jgi:CubicO group peptidase (beta-lactamase class C family)
MSTNVAAKIQQAWPNAAQMAESYVGEGRVANMVISVGLGDEASALLPVGRDTRGGSRLADVDSLYRIYSMTKPITGMAAMILIAEGKLGLDQPLAEILPKFANMQVQRVYDGGIDPAALEPAERPILIRNLMTHTAGLGYSIVQQGPIADLMRERGVVTGQISKVSVPELDRGVPVPSLTLFANRLAEIPLVYQPGTHWNYSTGLDVLGRVIEVVSGQPFDAFLKERIFRPCKMDSTFFRVPESELFRLTMNYAVLNGSLLPIDPPANSIFAEEPPFPMGGSGLVSSPRDYDRFLQMIFGYGMLDGRRIMPEAAVRMGTSNLLPDSAVVKGTSVEGYGFGAGGRIGWKGGKSGFGWAGAAGTVGFVDMLTGVRAGLFTQFMPGQTYPVFEELEQAITKDLAFQRNNS